ncbi:CmpA/NrtA family ABC transporter substrate-binding protein [Allosphingosinicella deserti]|uniref:Nitrate transporter n=1 Tax=Allosphingosinicella deserti TaxID=2116704 RepID=A0A2P7QVV7_9SPHN|nr:CmpA/NrtA family ABC transporter substrate-binding protein [Sphingomonas deserti]PSJ42083.1 nitrate transporter [Sphingomonas deserti]
MIPVAATFVPLTDSAILIAAHRLGFAAEAGIDLTLMRERSWATVRDRLLYGQVQVAHLLAPLALAVTLGIGHPAVALAAPFKLGMNGNALTLSSELAAALDPVARNRVDDPVATAHDLAAAIGLHRRKPILGIVHRYSSHALTLRYWLGFAGIDPDRDLQLRVLPPSAMVEALAAGEIDGFIAGEPWSSVAVEEGLGEIVAFTSNIWGRSVEKVLAMREDWAEANPDTVDRLLRALDRAAAWCEDPANAAELAAMLSDPEVIGEPAHLIERALAGRMALSRGGEIVDSPDFLMLHREAANFPWRSQALWIYSQFVRWKFVAPNPAAEARAARLFRSDIYRRALAGGATPLPGASLKVEGALAVPTGAGSDRGTLTLGPDRFFDGRIFDPVDIEAYLRSFKMA